ncbi:hypothetical protein [Aureispira anguillae]|uniref:Outer membrane protein beta-barrel domain-containing protein n=1 Tax=Aureispira anguillae TaxID=2864201 RepID=A0A915YE10_9BACT|nr:hypothetical protein [Aureispira anguillae]BDS11298.1 hypothetical protein AsAng_0020100 [Aureispira anguillae]
MKTVLTLFLCHCLFNLYGQKSGVSGYGHSEIIYMGCELSGDIYLGAGGGIVVNDNFQFGVYLRALNKPYKYDVFEASQKSGFQDSLLINPLSFSENVFSSSISNIETGVNVGFNIMPDKPFQITFNGMLGLNTVSFSEITATEDSTTLLGLRVKDELYTMFGINTALEVNFQFKIGGFLKMGVKGGYHFAFINGETRNGNLLRRPTMFSGPYIGASIVFGSF